MTSEVRWMAVILGAALTGSVGWAQTTERASVSSGGVQGNGFSAANLISADGRFVAFYSSASNLVVADTNAWDDVFVRDRQLGTMERVSLATGGAEANGPSYDGNESPAISADGRVVAFYSRATNLVAGDTNGVDDIFVRDRMNGTTERVSVATGGAQGSSGCSAPAISGDGRFVAFVGFSSNLVPGDTNSAADVFVRDRQLGTIERVSLATSGTQGNSSSYAPSISPDGRFVAFASTATNLVAGDTNLSFDIFLRDRLNGTTERVSVDSGGVEGDFTSYEPAISADGRFVAFHSSSSNLVAGDTNGVFDVFVRDRQLGTTERVSVATSGAQANAASDLASISADGRFVAFSGNASTLVAGDTNGTYDVFVRDRQLGTTERVSVGAGGGEGNNFSVQASLSADGRLVAFRSGASNFVPGDTNGVDDVYVRDRGGPPSPVPFCFGDGVSALCPCGNNGAAGNGCANSGFTAGARLGASGTPSVSADSLLFSASNLTGNVAVFFQGATQTPPTVIDDGLGCVGGPIIRLGNKPAVVGLSSFPQGGDPSVSVRGLIPPAGGTYQYQCFYRNAAVAFCPPATSNRTNGVIVLWIP